MEKEKILELIDWEIDRISNLNNHINGSDFTTIITRPLRNIKKYIREIENAKK